MAFVAVIGPCVLCRRVFAFNADLVPSVRVDGLREPICRDCVEAANPIRRERGLPAIDILPGAYDSEEI